MFQRTRHLQNTTSYAGGGNVILEEAGLTCIETKQTRRRGMYPSNIAGGE